LSRGGTEGGKLKKGTRLTITWPIAEARGRVRRLASGTEAELKLG